MRVKAKWIWPLCSWSPTRFCAVGGSRLSLSRIDWICASASEATRRKSSGSRVDFKECAGKRILCTSDCCGGHEQAIKVRTCECAAGYLRRRKRDRALQHALRREATDTRATPMGHPQVIVGVHRHSIGLSPIVREMYEVTSRSDRSVGIHGEPIDYAASGVGVIEPALIAAERRSVGDEIAGIEPLDGVVRVQSIQAAAGLIGVDRHGTGVDSSCAIGFGVVESVRRQVRFGADNRTNRKRFEHEFRKSAAQTGDKARMIPAFDHPASHLGESPRIHALILEPQAMKLSAQYIDPVERLVTCGPQRSFTQLIAIVTFNEAPVRHGIYDRSCVAVTACTLVRHGYNKGGARVYGGVTDVRRGQGSGVRRTAGHGRRGGTAAAVGQR